MVESASLNDALSVLATGAFVVFVFALFAHMLFSMIGFVMRAAGFRD